MKKLILRFASVVLAAIVSISSAQASLIKVSFDDIMFSDGSSISGSYIYDLDTMDVTDLNILGFGGTSAVLRFSGDLALNVFGPTGAQPGSLFLQLSFGQSLQSVNGLVALNNGTFLSSCISNTGFLNCSLAAQFGLELPNDSFATVQPVSAPAAASLFLIGLGAVVYRHRRPNSAV